MHPIQTAILLATSYVVSTIAGIPGTSGQVDGPAFLATFEGPTALAVMVDSDCTDPGDPGDIYVVDHGNQAIRRISRGDVSTFEALGGVNADPYKFDFGDRLGGGILIEPQGSGCGCMERDRGFFVASTGKNEVPEFSFDGHYAERDGTIIIGSRAGESLNTPVGLARAPSASADRYLYIADAGDHTIRRVAFALSPGGCPQAKAPEVFAGKPDVAGSADGIATVARFNNPRAIVAAPDGSLFVADTGNHMIRKISVDGSVTTVAGDPEQAGSNDGPARGAHFNGPTGLALNARGELFIADTGNNSIRMLTTDGQVVTVAGTPGLPSFADGQGSSARFNSPVGLAVTPDGSILVADSGNHAIRRISLPLGRRRAVRR